MARLERAVRELLQREGAEEWVFYDGPPFATGLALLIASESPTVSTLAGGSIAIAGVLIVNKTNSSKPNPKQGE